MSTFEEKLKRTEYICEANSNEINLLWSKYCKDSILKVYYDNQECLNKYNWEQDSCGHIETIGTLKGNPVNITCFWDKIDGMWIMFWEACSMFVDYSQIESWFSKRCPNIPKCNGMNFHLVLQAVKDKARKLVPTSVDLPN